MINKVKEVVDRSVDVNDISTEDDALDAAFDFHSGEGRPFGFGEARGGRKDPLLLHVDLYICIHLFRQPEDPLWIVVAFVHHVLDSTPITSIIQPDEMIPNHFIF